MYLNCYQHAFIQLKYMPGNKPDAHIFINTNFVRMYFPGLKISPTFCRIVHTPAACTNSRISQVKIVIH
jgi:hypothetical protein